MTDITVSSALLGDLLVPSEHQGSFDQALRFIQLDGPVSPLLPGRADVEKAAEVSWSADGRTVFYCGTDRYEFAGEELLHGGRERTPDAERNWKGELFELRTQLESARFELLYRSPLEFLKGEISVAKRSAEKFILNRRMEAYSLQLEEPDASRNCKFSPFYDHKRQENLSVFPGIEKSSHYQQSEAREQAFEYLIQQVQEKIERDPALAQRIFADRLALRERIEASGALLESQRVNVYLHDEGIGSGILGHARILSRSLHELAPNLEIRIFAHITADGTSVFHPKGFDNGVELIPVASLEEMAEHQSSASIHIYSGMSSDDFEQAQQRGDMVIPLRGVPGASLRPHDDCAVVETDSDYYQQPFTSFLQDPYGAVPFDLTIEKRARESASISLEELFARRAQWLEGEGNAPFRETLKELAGDGKWSVEKSVWSWAYFRNPDTFLGEMRSLENALRSPSFQKETMFVGDGEQIVIFAAQSRYLDRPIDPVEWNQLGFSVVTETGQLLTPPEGVERLPVTIVWHSGFKNTDVRELVSGLCGTCHMDAHSERIKFPLYVTGWASWYEAISAGQISLHDGVDQATDLMAPAIRLAWQRVAITSGVSINEQQEFVSVASSSMLMGRSDNSARYLDLETWSHEGSLFSRHMLPYNCAYDVVDGIQQREKKSSI